MDYGETLVAHVDSNADFTIACILVPKETANQFGVMQVDESGRLIGFAEKPDNPETLPDDPDTALASMGIYVFSYQYLKEQLLRDAADSESSHDFGKDLIPVALANGDRLHTYPFRTSATGGEGYWRDVGTIDAYYDANLEMLAAEPPIDIYNPAWPIRTYQPQLAAARFIGAGKRCRVEDVMVSGGCVINKSNLDRTLLYSNVKIGEGCDLQSVLALPGCEIGAGCRLKGVILDNGCVVPDGTVIGENSRIDRKRFHITERGVVVVNRKMLGQDSGYRPSFVLEG